MSPVSGLNLLVCIEDPNSLTHNFRNNSKISQWSLPGVQILHILSKSLTKKDLSVKFNPNLLNTNLNFQALQPSYIMILDSIIFYVKSPIESNINSPINSPNYSV